ncbi:MAG: bifunctional phosphoribosyl-AMP cyclohydrolase/phosphoribosyl-ATP diphosphatase HisIE [Bacteroidales bacterium]
MNLNNLNFEKTGGLLPVVVQDAATNVVLMQAWMNREALLQTLDSGKLTFFSRSKNRLWTKGESSGNFLYLKELLPDCDNDCILAKAEPAGPACHTGQDTCFGEGNLSAKYQQIVAESETGNTGFLEELEQLLNNRKNADPSKSYTARLFEAGPKRIAKKLGEEAVELALEAESGDPQRFIEEAADLIYHLNVLLISRDTGWEAVIRELQNRYHPGR